MKTDLSSLARLSDSELVGRVRHLAGRERDAMAEIIAHLGEIEARDLYARAGHKSLFEFPESGSAALNRSRETG